MAYQQGTAGNDVLRGSDSADSIYGYAGDDTLYGYGGADTLDGGVDDDVLYGGNGGDTFVYKLNQGNDVIADYTKADKIYFQDSTPTADDFTIDGNNLVVNIGSGSITILNAVTSGRVNKTITYIDKDGVSHSYPELIYYNKNRTGATLLGGYNDDSFDATALGENYTNLATIDGSAVTHDIEITGNKKANKIFGGTGSDTIYAGSGNDTLTGGDGDDVFAFTGGQGRNYITDYEMGDVIKITSGTLSGAALSGSNYVFTIKSGSKTTTVTVKDARNKYIQVEDASGNTSWYPEDPTPYATYSKGKVTLQEKYAGDQFNVTDFESGFAGKVYTIDAAAVTHSIYITGNKEKNTIIGSENDDTIDGGTGADYIAGGEGNDVLIGGAGKDTFAYNKGDGNDTILDYEEKDVIVVNGTTVKNTVASGSDAILQLVGNSNITLVGAAGKKITYVDGDNPDPDEDNIEFSNSGKKVTLLEKYSEDTFDVNYLSSYASKVVTIDASAVENALTITANKKPNVIIGTEQKDTIYGGDGADTITGGGGNDILTGGDGADVFVYEKGDGNDVISDYTGDDAISISGVTVKTVTANNSGDIILKLSDNKRITVTGGASTTITGSVNGIDTVFYDPDPDPDPDPDDTLKGALYNENHTAVTLTADFVNESFTSSDYNAYVNKLRNIDASAVDHEMTIGGSSRANNITGTADADYIYGGAGKDTLKGGKGSDSLEGGDGNDKLYGGAGKDTLWGGAGDDTLTGGAGNDVFIYNADGNDVITDYTWGYDTIICQNGTIRNVAAEGTSVVFTMSNGSELTLLNASVNPARIYNGSGTPMVPEYNARATS